VVGCSRRVATADFPIISNYFQPSLRDECFVDPTPALKRWAKFMTALRANRA